MDVAAQASYRHFLCLATKEQTRILSQSDRRQSVKQTAQVNRYNKTQKGL